MYQQAALITVALVIGYGTPVAPPISSSHSVGSNPTFEVIFRNGLLVSEDQFAEPPSVPSLKDEIIHIPFTDGNDSYPSVNTSAIFTYADGELVLHFSSNSTSDVLESTEAMTRRVAVNDAPGSSYRSRLPPVTYREEVVAYSRLTPAGSFVGTNALGVRTRVQRYDLRTITIAFNEGPKPASTRMKMRFRLTGPEARQLAQVAAVEVRIKDPSAFSNGAKCSHLLHSAKLQKPKETDDLNCAVKAEVETWRFIRRDTGEELRGKTDNI